MAGRKAGTVKTPSGVYGLKLKSDSVRESWVGKDREWAFGKPRSTQALILMAS